jgi:serine/threonine-protein kinase
VDPADRPVFLSAVCGGDRALREEVESLLAAAGRTLSMLQRPVREAARSAAAAESLSHHRIGNFELIRLIGEGGMGEVYLAARADDQFRQYVAIKLMRIGLEQAQDLVPRFLAERQILANLDHPNIARLLDGGLTLEGWPYLVMELVDGIPIDEYCHGHRLPTIERLRLFRTVCSAVEYTHHNLVVHRDIKPANILINTKRVPKLLDFGIAELVDAAGADRDPTAPAVPMMTPEYASPEQILGRPVTTASDVFALGILLYELLAGCNPFRFRAASPVELIRDICERDPPPLSVAAEPNPDQAAPDNRRWTPELDSILRKAMRKNPAERYQSAGQLSADIAAYEEGRPVSAYARNWRYLANKFVRRHRAALALAVVAAIGLIAVTIGMAALARRATVERLKAAREAQFLVDMFKAATPEVARGEAVTARDLLDRGVKRIDTDLASVPAVQASMLHSLAESYQGLGLYGKAELLAERSYKMKSAGRGPDDADAADTLFLLANLVRLQGDYARAEPLFQRLVAIRRKTASTGSLLYATSLNALGECLYLQSKDTEAETLLRQALDIDRRNGPDFGSDGRNHLALLLQRKGDCQEAVILLTEAVAIDKRTQGVNSPSYAASVHNLAGALIDMGDLSGAEMNLREALAIRRKILGSSHPDVACTLDALGVVLLEKGDWRSAELYLREALEIAGGNDPRIISDWGRLLTAKGDRAGARFYFHQALDRLRKANAFTSWQAAQVFIDLGLVEFDENNYEAAETLARQAMETRRALGGERTPALASALTDVAEAELFQGFARNAERLLRPALEIRGSKFPSTHPAVIAAKVRLGEALIAEGEESEAEPLLREALASARSAQFQLLPWQVAEAESALAASWIALGRNKEALPLERSSQPALAAHPRPPLRKQAAFRLLPLNRTAHPATRAAPPESPQ